MGSASIAQQMVRAPTSRSTGHQPSFHIVGTCVELPAPSRASQSRKFPVHCNVGSDTWRHFSFVRLTYALAAEVFRPTRTAAAAYWISFSAG